MRKQIILTLLLPLAIFSQIKLTIESEKPEYQYGEELVFICKLINISDTTVNFRSRNYHSCQVQFYLNDLNSADYFVCLPTVEEISIQPGAERVYKWRIDPHLYALPNKDGEQRLIGYYSHPQLGYLTDTTTFVAPLFRGGQIYLHSNYGMEPQVDSLRNYYGFELVRRGEYIGSFYEVWQILDIQVDAAASLIEKTGLFSVVEVIHPPFTYESVITSVENENLEFDFNLHQNYPNPFNPTTSIEYQVSSIGNVTLNVYDVLGREITTIVNEVKHPGTHEVTFDASELPSGVYFYRLTQGKYSTTKKMLLMK